MTTYLPKDLRDDLEAARLANLGKRSRWRVVIGETSFPVLRLRRNGFSVDQGKVPPLRGLVDVYDGPRHLYQCLIVATAEEAGEMWYEFKRNTAAEDKAPLDHIRETPVPTALLT